MKDRRLISRFFLVLSLASVTLPSAAFAKREWEDKGSVSVVTNCPNLPKPTIFAQEYSVELDDSIAKYTHQEYQKIGPSLMKAAYLCDLIDTPLDEQNQGVCMVSMNASVSDPSGRMTPWYPGPTKISYAYAIQDQIEEIRSKVQMAIQGQLNPGEVFVNNRLYVHVFSAESKCEQYYQLKGFKIKDGKVVDPTPYRP